MKSVLLVLLAHLLISCSSSKVVDLVPPKNESRLVALREAYIYGYPLVTMEMTKRILTNVKRPTHQGLAPINQLAHREIFPNHDIKEFLHHNLDILYSQAFLDLSEGPVILSVPESKDRYFSIQIMNGWTDVIGSMGTRMEVEGARSYFIHGPMWRGIPPKNMKVLASSTNLNWILGRTYIHSKKDFSKAISFMKKYQLTRTKETSNSDVKTEYLNKTPEVLVEKMSGDSFLNLLNTLLLQNPPPKKDRPQLEKMAKVGVGAGLVFDVDNFSPEEQRYLSELPSVIALELARAEKSGALVNGWDLNLDSRMGNYGVDYYFRAQIALTRLGMPLREDALFPEAKVDSDGEPFSGQYQYILHFNKGQNPPSRALWSLTTYGTDQAYKLDDKIDLLYNADGSLDIYIQNTPPTGNKKKNWLPTPRGLFTIQSRIYWPESRALSGQWAMPAVLKNKDN